MSTSPEKRGKLPKSETLDQQFLKDTQYPPEVKDFYKPPPRDWYAIIVACILVSIAFVILLWLI